LKNLSIDIRTGNAPEEIKQSILDHLFYSQGRTKPFATMQEWYMATSYAVRDRMMSQWIDTLANFKKGKIKIVGYLSAEFLEGPHLANAMLNLGITDNVKRALDELNVDYHQLIQAEEEPGLGNGGLGRLAACYLDSLSTLAVPAVGYGIRYEFGIFDQKIENGEQIEITDKWLRFGNPWEIAQPHVFYKVQFGGHTERWIDENQTRVKWISDDEVKGIAYDTPIPGYRNGHINLLRLWKSEACESFNFGEFNRGNYALAVVDKVSAETITKVLYPNDETEAGKKLRLMQQYFFVSCSLQDSLRIIKQRKLTLHELPDVWAFQLNDTHPSIAIAEMMRLLLDEEYLKWDAAWEITTRTFAYTNHTLLPEALEKWALPLFQSILPRHLEIIYEINHRFLEKVKIEYPGNAGLLANLSIIEENGSKYVRMANLAAIGSHTINGVSALHSELLIKDVLRDFHFISPGKIINVTNGVTPRRWMQLYNPEMAALITETLGETWVSHLESELVNLEKFADDPAFRERWRKIKKQNKQLLSGQLKKTTGILTDPDSLFDIQVKRIHEYKRQHLNLLHIIALYNRIKNNPQAEIVPRTFIFGGKAAPGYYLAKLIIRLINGIGDVVNNDIDVAGRLKVVFYPDYNVKNSEWVYRAADVSEQISTAGKEASGTGNMKFALNGALTIGTLDGANLEMRDRIGSDHFFLFGLQTEEVAELKASGYNPIDYYLHNAELKAAIDMIQSGAFSNGNGEVFKPLTDSLLYNDPYLVMADFADYVKVQEQVSKAYKDSDNWTRSSILNVARMGYFSSDRSIREYCDKVWHVGHNGTAKSSRKKVKM
jgi:starch phosphorylase